MLNYPYFVYRKISISFHVHLVKYDIKLCGLETNNEQSVTDNYYLNHFIVIWGFNLYLRVIHLIYRQLYLPTTFEIWPNKREIYELHLIVT